jgi:hypothetical protein
MQVAVSLPLFLFTLPSGALADVTDSRRLLIASKKRFSQFLWFSLVWFP